jgi:hypothetical protein
MYKSPGPWKEWLRINSMFCSQQGTKEKTHYLLDRGVLNVPDIKSQFFLQKYADFLSKKVPMFVVELKTPVFRMFGDWDFFNTRGTNMSIDEMCAIVRISQQVMQSCFPYKSSLELRTIMCYAPRKYMTDKDGDEVEKDGWHTVWPDIYVDEENAIKLITLIFNKTVKTFGERKVKKYGWTKVIDKSVYECNGLRMIGSRKMVKCKSCKKQTTQHCTECNGTQMADEGRAYVPVSVLDGNGIILKDELEKLEQNTTYTVMQNTLRTELSKQKDKIYFALDDIELLQHLKFTRDVKGSKRSRSDDKVYVTPTKSKKSGFVEVQTLTNDTGLVSSIEMFIKRVFPKIPSLKVTKIMGMEDKCYLLKTNSNFCLNLGREHETTSIYFHVGKSGIAQKCFCRCDTTEGRLSGKRCCDFTSSRIMLPVKLYRVFFGQPPSSYKIKPAPSQAAPVSLPHGTSGQLTFLSNLIHSIKEVP